jgi:hypothetical protein
LKRPFSTRSHRSSSIATDQDISIVNRYNSKDNRLKRAAAQERRQATRKYRIFYQ